MTEPVLPRGWTIDDYFASILDFARATNPDCTLSLDDIQQGFIDTVLTTAPPPIAPTPHRDG